MKKKALLKMSDAKLDEVVKIQGTIYDRKRKLNNVETMNAKSMINSGKSVGAVAKHFGVDARTIRYNTDDNYRESVLAKASGKHTGITTCDFAERVAYKRSLIEANKKSLIIND